MAVLKIAHLGHPILRQKAEPVSPEAIGSPDVQRLIDDMLETMDDHDGAGLAAPQVHVSRRIVIYGVRANPRYPDAEAVPLTVLVNPVITPLTKEVVEDWEGCLSIPDIRGRVPRAREIKLRGMDRHGHRLDLHLRDFPARVAQHETDHLDGVLFFDRMKTFGTLTFMDEYSRYWSKDED